jgi:hypothetical protein
MEAEKVPFKLYKFKGQFEHWHRWRDQFEAVMDGLDLMTVILNARPPDAPVVPPVAPAAPGAGAGAGDGAGAGANFADDEVVEEDDYDEEVIEDDN